MAREKRNSVSSTSAAANELESTMEWSPEDEVHLFFALDGLKPVGVNRHFNMFFASERLCKSLNREIPTQQIWAHLNAMFNLEMLEEIEPLPFPNDIKDFSLPEAEFATYLSKKREESEEKKMSDSSSDAAGKDKTTTKSKSDSTSMTPKMLELPKRAPKRTRGSISLESSSPSTTPPPIQKRRRI